MRRTAQVRRRDEYQIFESMAMGSAVGSTRISAEGVPVTDGDNILPADSSEDFAA